MLLADEGANMQMVGNLAATLPCVPAEKAFETGKRLQQPGKWCQRKIA
jgi:hypothetical protein